jgi:hypothetical protein
LLTAAAIKVTSELLLDNPTSVFKNCPVPLVGLCYAEQSFIPLSQASLHGSRQQYLQLANYSQLKPSSYTEAICHITPNYRTIFYFNSLLFRKCQSKEAYL